MNRADSMKNHLLAQFADKKNIYAILEALGEEMDELDIVFEDLRTKRWINTGVGVQLDGIGEIVGRPRLVEWSMQLEFFGFDGQPNTQTFGVGRFRDSNEAWLMHNNLSDTEYRLILLNKIARNTTKGTAEETITSIKRLFNAPYVVVEDAGNARITIGIGRKLLANEVIFVKAVNLLVVCGGVGTEWWSNFNADKVLGFYGQPHVLGFEQGEFADILNVMGG